MNERRDLPAGTVTFLFTDIEGSTDLLQRIGDRYPAVFMRHHELLRAAFSRHGGVEVGTEGDSFFVVFPTAPQAIAAAVEAQVALVAEPWPDDAVVRVRMGLHTGRGTLSDGDYVGIDVHRAARIAAAGHGGQILTSGSTQRLLEYELPDGASLLDLGEHRLKDLLHPERIFQVLHPRLPDTFPPPRTLSARPNNLPVQTTEFFGREAELAAVRELLHTPEVRLVTLTGPGGIGKTRLAVQLAAEQIERCEDGVFFVALESVRDPDGVFDAIVDAVGLPVSRAGVPFEAAVQQLEARRVFLVLDNVEQVVDAAEQIVELLHRCQHLWVLVTSRVALSVRGEHVFAVPALAVPPADVARLSAEEASAFESVRLFVDRARQARPDFDLTDDNAAEVADISVRLDGLPLAIELAAARLKLFSPHELQQRLEHRLQLLRGGPRDLPARQQTLHDAIAWSYELLDGDQRSLLCFLAVFSGAALEAVEAAALRVASLRGVDVVEQLTTLVDHSLVRSAEAFGSRRLSMLETIREYAAERLGEDPVFSAAARRAHAEHFLEFTRQLRPELERASREAALDRLATEMGNLRSAWRFWLDVGDLDALDIFLEPLWALHETRGWYAGAVELAQDLLELLAADPATRERVEQRVLLSISVARGLMAIRGFSGEVDEAYRRAVTLVSEAGELPRLFPALRSLASLHLYRGEFAEAVEVGRRLLDLAEQQQDDGLASEAHLVLGVNIASLGDMLTGLDHVEQALTLFDRSQQRPGQFQMGASPGVVARTTSAFMLWLLWYPDRARGRADDALALADKLNHPFTLAYCLFHVALFALWRDEPHLAHERAERALRVAEEHDYPVWRALALVVLGVAMVGLGQPEEGLARSEQGMALYRGLDSPPAFLPLLLAVTARGFALAGRPADGLACIDEAIELYGGSEDFLYPELPLLKGDLLLAASGPEAAEPWFQQAFDVGGTTAARCRSCGRPHGSPACDARQAGSRTGPNPCAPSTTPSPRAGTPRPSSRRAHSSTHNRRAGVSNANTAGGLCAERTPGRVGPSTVPHTPAHSLAAKRWQGRHAQSERARLSHCLQQHPLRPNARRTPAPVRP